MEDLENWSSSSRVKLYQINDDMNDNNDDTVNTDDNEGKTKLLRLNGIAYMGHPGVIRSLLPQWSILYWDRPSRGPLTGRDQNRVAGLLDMLR